jgi:hypothetical protein
MARPGAVSDNGGYVNMGSVVPVVPDLTPSGPSMGMLGPVRRDELS